MAESAGRSRRLGATPAATRWEPSAATIAPLSVHSPGRGTRTAMPCRRAALLGERPQPGVGRHPAADHQRPHAVRPAGVDGLGGQHVAHRLLEAGGHVGDRHRLAGPLARLHPAGHRRLQARRRRSRTGARPGPRARSGRAGTRSRRASPSRAARSIGGPPGNGSPSSRATLSNASPAASSMVAPSGVTPLARSSTSSSEECPPETSRRSPARAAGRAPGCPPRRARPGGSRRRCGFSAASAYPLAAATPDQQRAGQPRPGRHRDRVHVGQGHPGVVQRPLHGGHASPPGGPGWPPPAPPRRSGRARPHWTRARRPAACARGRCRHRSRRRRSRCRAPAVRQSRIITSASVLLGW